MGGTTLGTPVTVGTGTGSWAAAGAAIPTAASAATVTIRAVLDTSTPPPPLGGGVHTPERGRSTRRARPGTGRGWLLGDRPARLCRGAGRRFQPTAVPGRT